MVLNPVSDALNPLISPFFSSLSPVLGIFIISLFTGLILIFVNKLTIWSPESKKIQEALKKSQKKFKEEMDAAKKKGDTKKIEELTKKSLEEQSKHMSQSMKYSFKPLIVSILLALVLLPWMSMFYKDAFVVIPNIIPVIGGVSLAWIWWYFICSLVISLVGKQVFENI